jgi:hypothetical protein
MAERKRVWLQISDDIAPGYSTLVAGVAIKWPFGWKIIYRDYLEQELSWTWVRELDVPKVWPRTRLSKRPTSNRTPWFGFT